VDRQKETARGDLEAFEHEEGSTCPAAWPGQPSERRTPSHEGAKGAKSPKGGFASSSGRPRAWRRGAARTWNHGRRAILEDLAVITDRLTYLTPCERASILAAAASQTSASYNPALGFALDWAPLILRWLDLTWAERGDEIRARIVPALRAALIPTGPRRPAFGQPNEAQAREIRIAQEQRETRDANAQPRCPVDAAELQELRGRLYIARTAARAIAAGRMRFEDLAPDMRALVERCAEVFGPLVG
jgi:hypothetical protein